MKSTKHYGVLYLLMVAGAGVLPLEQQDKSRNSDNFTPLPEAIDDNFVTNLRRSLEEIDTLQRPFLIHTQESLLVFVNKSKQRSNLSISTTLYKNLQAISHLPVTAVSLLIPELLSNGDSLPSPPLNSSVRQRLDEFRMLVQNVSLTLSTTDFTSASQYMRQDEIVNNVITFLDNMLDSQSSNITMNTLEMFTNSLAGHLKSNSEDAVLEYLLCLNSTISSLEMSQQILTDELVIVLSVEPFSQRGSFLFQYYLQLLNIDSQSERLILLPSRSTCNSTQTNTLFSTTLYQSISQLFYKNASAPVHTSLSQAATNLICSNSFVLLSCVSESSVEGFHTRLEKSYVVLMMAFGGVAVLFGIVLSCITYEDRLMASERKDNENVRSFKLEGPNVFTPVSSLSEAEDSMVVRSSEENSRNPSLRRPLLSSDSPS